MHFLSRIIAFLCFISVTAQSVSLQDSLYVEDQFYIRLAYNLFKEKPALVSQNNFPLHFGFGAIKDIPISKKRNIALAAGLGYATDAYFSTIRASKTQGKIHYRVLEATDSYRRNKLETHSVVLPLEFRWRTANATSYKFWRIYSGIAFSYVFLARSKFVSSQIKDVFTNTDVIPWQYGCYINFGYNTWNFHAYYGFSNILKKTAVLEHNNDPVAISILRLGLTFYIL